MFKVVIADDEGFIRRGIISILKRNVTEEITFYEASTTDEALTHVTHVNPDLIITDIRMPGVSGLDFIATLRNNNQNTAVIIISGYEDFKYAQKAIALGVKKYMTKPVDKQELIDLVMYELHNRNQRSLYKKKEFQKVMASNAMQKELRESLLLQLINESNPDKAKDIVVRLKKMQVPFKSTAYTCAVIQYRNETALDFIDFSVSNITQEYLSCASHVHFLGFTKCSDNEIVILLSGEDAKNLFPDIQLLFSEIIRKLISFYQYDFYAGIGNVVYEAELISRSFSSARKAAGYKLFDKMRYVQIYPQLKKGTTLSKEAEQHLIKSLKSLDGVTIAQEFALFTKDPYTKRNMLSLQEMYQQLEQELLHHILMCQFNTTFLMPALPDLQKLWGISDLNQAIFAFTAQVRKNISTLNVSPANQKLLSDIILYIQSHLSETLDLNLVADIFDRNPSYISSLFKKGMQTGFNEYVNQERISLSKKYLKDSSIPINKVAGFCGYINPKYYSVVFKKLTGLTPMEYRDKSIIIRDPDVR